jgi:hypothetical protein
MLGDDVPPVTTGGYSHLPPLGALRFTPISHILSPHIEREEYLCLSVKKKIDSYGKRQAKEIAKIDLYPFTLNFTAKNLIRRCSPIFAEIFCT